MLVGYAAILLVWYAYCGLLFQFSIGLVFLALVPLTLVLGRTTQLVREMTPFVVLLLSYEALQGIAGTVASGRIVQLIPHAGSSASSLVGTVQTVFYSPNLTDAMSVLYGLHFPLVMGSAILLWYSDKTLYRRYVYSLTASSYISLLFYLFMPSAPPWYTGVATNLLDSGTLQFGASNLISSLDNVGELIESDKLAAFPSLHAAYIVLFCYFTLKLRKKYGLVSLPITVGVLFSTIYLGQHFIIDLGAGAAIAAACVLIITRTAPARNVPRPGVPNALGQ
jgi:membrane-associated phospholipid phosphatase